MKIIENQTYPEERALYGSHNLLLKHCRFDGKEDGESALKECQNIQVTDCFCNLHYPFWHNCGLHIDHTTMTELCRAALWYSQNISITNSKLHGIKALRECSHVTIEHCDILSPEFGWSVQEITMRSCTVESVYFMMRSAQIHFDDVQFKGKYSFQYIQDAVFENCTFDTKDAFWHAKNVTVRDSVVKGEYLAWYSDGLTLERCKIIGTQPLCYCKNLKLIDCKMLHTDLAFEKSDVDATITTNVDSIKNPYVGTIRVPSVTEVIRDDPKAVGVIRTGNPT